MSARTFQPVRRCSYNRGEREHRIWHPYGETKKDGWRFRDAVLRAARRYDDQSKEPGMRMGALGLTGVKVLETLFTFADLATGRLEPAIDTICAQAKLARGTVVRALARLRDHGFLDWLRRTEPVDNDGEGPQVRQVTNAYWFALRGRAAGLVRLMLHKAPPTRSRDEVDAELKAERDSRLAGMRARARVDASAFVSDDVRAALGRLREERQRQGSSASITKGQNPGSQGVKR